jgi:hypothetical protein
VGPRGAAPSEIRWARFTRSALKLDAGGHFIFDAVSSDGFVAACVCTSAGITAGGKKGSSHLHKIRSDMLFLLMAVGVKSRLVVLTDRRMYEICEAEQKKGRLPTDVEVVLAEPPQSLQDQLARSRRLAATEVTPAERGGK